MTLVDAPYQELRWDRTLSWTVHDALQIPTWTKERGAHLGCGSGLASQLLDGQRSTFVHAIEPHEELIAKGKAQPFASENFLAAYLAAGGDSRKISAPIRRNFSFRCEPLTRTSIRTHSMHRVILEWGQRNNFAADAVVEEVCRIGRPDCVVVVVHYGVLEVDEWATNDTLHPELLYLRRLFRTPMTAFNRLGLVQVARGEQMYATGCFDLAGVMRAIDESPETERLLAIKGWPGAGHIHRALRKAWGRSIITRNVRRRVAVWVGKVPATPAESAKQA